MHLHKPAQMHRIQGTCIYMWSMSSGTLTICVYVCGGGGVQVEGTMVTCRLILEESLVIYLMRFL